MLGNAGGARENGKGLAFSIFLARAPCASRVPQHRAPSITQALATQPTQYGHLVNSLAPLYKYRKILIISPGLIFVQKAFLVGLFSGELIFGGAYYWREFYISKWVGLDNKNS